MSVNAEGSIDNGVDKTLGNGAVRFDGQELVARTGQMKEDLFGTNSIFPVFTAGRKSSECAVWLVRCCCIQAIGPG